MLTAQPAGAQNIDVSTVPERESVQLTIYNSKDITLVRERDVATSYPSGAPISACPGRLALLLRC